MSISRYNSTHIIYSKKVIGTGKVIQPRSPENSDWQMLEQCTIIELNSASPTIKRPKWWNKTSKNNFPNLDMILSQQTVVFKT